MLYRFSLYSHLQQMFYFEKNGVRKFPQLPDSFLLLSWPAWHRHVQCSINTVVSKPVFPEAAKGCFTRGRHLVSTVRIIILGVTSCGARRTMADVVLEGGRLWLDVHGGRRYSRNERTKSLKTQLSQHAGERKQGKVWCRCLYFQLSTKYVIIEKYVMYPIKNVFVEIIKCVTQTSV